MVCVWSEMFVVLREISRLSLSVIVSCARSCSVWSVRVMDVC